MTTCTHTHAQPRDRERWRAAGSYTEPFCYKTYAGINHAVTVVGYGNMKDQSHETEPAMPAAGDAYWLVKNSWVRTFGF
jgi:C1A family cysteine protease